MPIDADTERKVLQCVDEVLEMLGKDGRQALTHCLERTIGLTREEIVQKPELFRKGLDLVLGEHGADVLETTIVKKLLARLGLRQKSKPTLAQVIDIIKATQVNGSHFSPSLSPPVHLRRSSTSSKQRK